MSIVISKPPEYMEEVMTEWRDNAIETVRQYCQANPGKRFTTKDIWPLLDNPEGDKRVMGVVMGRVVKSGVADRIDVVPDPGPAMTRDGVSIPYNRAVSQFVSLA